MEYTENTEKDRRGFAEVIYKPIFVFFSVFSVYSVVYFPANTRCAAESPAPGSTPWPIS
jgi:hypothetical protein